MSDRSNRRRIESDHLTRRRVLAGSAALGAGAIAGPLAGTGSVGADGSRAGITDPPSPSRHPANSSPVLDVSLDGIEEFVDEQMTDAVEDGPVVGASAAVVRSDETVVANGYGEKRPGGEPVDADTQFRVGSVSKPFVWTAAMGLIEEGRIDPHEDVRTYLDSVPVAETYDEPITMAHLATHTAGFEPRNQGLWIADAAAARPLAEVLESEQPARVRPPGRQVSYSNYGTALAGQVVEDVVGRPLETYLEEEILDSIDASTATFEQPPPDDASAGYTALLGEPTEAPGLAVESWPAGSLSTSANDLARFVRAHLGDGSADGGGDGEQVLSSEGLDRMHERWFSHHPDLDGLAFGWFEESHGDVRVLWHNGAIPQSFYSHVLFVPEADVGLVLAYNTDAGAQAAHETIDAFLDEYVPQEEPEPLEPDGRPDRADALEGTYRSLRVAVTTHSRLPTTLQAGEVDVEVDDEGYLVTDDGGEQARWVQREPLVFEEAEGDDALAFEDENGTITHLYVGSQAFRRRPWHESVALHGGLAAGSTLGMLAGAVAWPAARGWRRLRGGNGDAVDPENTEAEDEPDGSAIDTQPHEIPGEVGGAPAEGDSNGAPAETSQEGAPAEASQDVDQKRDFRDAFGSPGVARWTLGASIAAVFTFGLGALAGLLLDPTLLGDPPLWYRILLVLPVLAALGTVVSVASAALAWRAGAWRRRSLTLYGLVAASTALASGLLYYWNFFGTPG